MATQFKACKPQPQTLPQVLHGMRVPEQPLFKPDVPYTGKPETGCSSVEASSAVEAVRRFCTVEFSPPSNTSAMKVPAVISGNTTALDSSSAVKTAKITDSGLDRSATVADFHFAYRNGRSCSEQ